MSPNQCSSRGPNTAVAVCLGLLCLVLAACKGSDDDSAACSATAPSACVEPAPHYADVKPIFDRSCATLACHSGEDQGEWPLTSYEDVESWASVIRSELLHCAMPPPDSGMTIGDDERRAILDWVQCGALE